MTTTSVEEIVKKIVTKIVRKSDADFAKATSFKDLEADSLDIVQILVPRPGA
jgi:acyl carrier protein